MVAVPAVTALFPERKVAQIRTLFPALERTIDGHPLVYLDTAATALRPARVIDAGCHFCRMHDGNPHRGLHTLSAEATEAYEMSRQRVADWFKAPSTNSVVITRNATAALNLVARGLEHMLNPGDEILLTEMEHHANLVPWMMLGKRKGVKINYIPVDKTGHLDLSTLSGLLNDRTRVVSLTHVSNVLGTINPVREIAEAARKKGAFVVVDAAQSVGHLPVTFEDLNADFVAFSAHKCYGPTGLGFLVGRPDSLELIEPLETGGEMIDFVDFHDATWAPVPHRFEAGTGNASAVSAFPQAIELMEEVGASSLRIHDRLLVEYAMEHLLSLDLQVLGPLDVNERSGLISFVDSVVHPHDLATILNESGIAIRAGHHCAQPLHRKMGIGSSARISFGIYSNKSDVDALIGGIKTAREIFGR